MQHRIVGAAREAAHTKGYQTQLEDVLKYAGIHKSTLYVHFDGIEVVLRTLAAEIVQKTWDYSLELVDRIKADEDGRMIFVDWAYHGFNQVQTYGQLAVEMCFPEGEGIPPWLDDVTKWDEMLVFTGYLIKHCQRQGHCRDDVNTRAVVRSFYSMVSPQHVRWCLREGLTLDEIRAETLDGFFRTYATESALKDMEAMFGGG